jgi:hypothetical protein
MLTRGCCPICVLCLCGVVGWWAEQLVTGPTHHKDDPLLLEKVRRSIGRQAHLF